MPWLVKQEPDSYSWDMFVKDGKADWTGVRNYQARNNLQAMQMGDEVLYYHSNIGLEVVGVARVTRAAFQDPTTDDARWVAVELVPDRPLKKPVPLADMKQVPALENIGLIRQGRLSVMPLAEDEFKTILKLGGL